jgi:hypothetical protein
MTIAAREACVELLNEFLGVSDDPPDAVAAAFGSTDPWKNVAMDYVMDSLTDVTVDPDDFPQAGECDLPIAGINMGKLVAASSLDAGARSAIRIYIRLVRGELLPFYDEALKSFVAAGDEARATPAEERRVLQETGMPLVESLALAMAMAVYSVLPKSELAKISYGADPMAWSGFKQQVKFGNGTFLDFKGAKADPAELRRRLKRVAKTLRDKGWPLASATLTSFVDDLSEITCDEGVPEFFLEYYNEFMEVHRCRGLIASAPLDAEVLRSKVLGRRRGGGGGNDPTILNQQAALQLQMDDLMKEAKRSQSQVASLRDTVSRMRDENPAGGKSGGGDSSSNPKPGEDERCYECGGVGHFGYQCEKRKAREARALAKEGADKDKDKVVYRG